MLRIKGFIFVMLSFFSVVLLQAHSPYEIGFFINQDENNLTFLKIHLTPQTAIDLAKEIHPELKNSNVFSLNDYGKDYENYFNKTINLSFNNSHKELKFLSSNIANHDSFIEFQVLNEGEKINQYNIEIMSFSFYKNPTFILNFDFAGAKSSCSLSKINRTCSNQISKQGEEKLSKNKFHFHWWYFPLFIIGIITIFYIVKHFKIQ